MKLKYVGAAGALALGLAVGGAAAAQTATNNGDRGLALGGSVSIPGVNGNTVGDGNDNSNRHNDASQTNANSVGSSNTLGSNNSSLRGSQDDNSNQRNDYSNNSGQNNSLNVALRANVTDQNLSGNVSGLSIGTGEGGERGPGSAVTTGDVRYNGGAYQGWAGIQTASTNTGLASNNLAATSVSASANVNFGGGAGGSQ